MADVSHLRFRDDLRADTSNVQRLADALRSDSPESLRRMVADMLEGRDPEFALVVKRKARGRPAKDPLKLYVIAGEVARLMDGGQSKTAAIEQVACEHECSSEYVRKVVADIEDAVPQQEQDPDN